MEPAFQLLSPQPLKIFSKQMMIAMSIFIALVFAVIKLRIVFIFPSILLCRGQLVYASIPCNLYCLYKKSNIFTSLYFYALWGHLSEEYFFSMYECTSIKMEKNYFEMSFRVPRSFSYRGIEIIIEGTLNNICNCAYISSVFNIHITHWFNT